MRQIRTFSKKSQMASEALSIYFNQIVYDLKRKGKDIITLSLGEAFFDIPLFDFNLLDLEKCHHYTDSSGIPELKKKISRHYFNNFKVNSNYKNEILISAGSKAIIYMSIQALVDPGDEVVLHEPAWLSYADQIRMSGGKPVFIPYDVKISELRKYISKKTKLIIINNPNNPAGKIYSKVELKSILKVINKTNIWLLVDEAYSDFALKQNFISIGSLSKTKKNIVIVNSLSKNMGISGWRIGYAISNDKFIKQILKFNQHIITCAPSILMHYLERYFDNILKVTRPQIDILLEKRKKIFKLLKKNDLKFLAGTSTFYFFIDIGKFPGTSTDFTLQMLLEHNIAVVPGIAYGKSTKRFIRISIGTESFERVEKAIILIAKEILNKKINKKINKKKIKDFLLNAN